MPETCVLMMPVYNEAECIQQACLDWLPVAERHGGLLLVVDDGSTDATPVILERMTRRHSALRVVRQSNAGHGSAVLHGYREAVRSGADWVFQTDSDRQFDPADFGELWVRRAQHDFLLGCRSQRSDHAVRVALSRLHRGVLGLLFGVRLADPNVPFRLMRTTVLEQLLHHVPQAVFAPNVFLSILAAGRNEGLLESTVRHLPRRSGEVSIRGWRTLRVGLRCLAEMIGFRMGAWRRFRRSVHRATSAPPEVA